MSNREVLTSTELAEVLGIHWRTIHRLRDRGEGPPAIKIGRVYRYRRADVEEWLRGQALPANDRHPAREEVNPSAGRQPDQ